MASVQNSSTPAVPEKPSQKKPIPPLRRKLPRMHSPPPTPSKVHNSPSLPTPPKASPPPPPPMPSRAPRLSWSRSDDPFFRYVQNTYSKADHFGFVSWEQPETKSNLAKVLEGENSRAAKWRAMAIEVPVSPALKEVAASERAFGMRGLVAITSAETVPVKVAISPIFSFTKNERFLQRIWKGLPHVWRGYVWYHLITTSSGLYNGLDADEISQMESEELGRYLAKAREGKVSKFDKVITSDAAQTFVNHILFMTEDSAGPNFPSPNTFIFLLRLPRYWVFPWFTQNDGYATRVFMSLMHLYSDEEHFNLGMLHTQTQETLDELFFVQENLLRLWAPRLHAKMISFGIRPAAYASSWYTTLFHVCLPAAYTAREGQVVAKNATGLIPFRIFIRLWDIFMLNGFNFLPVIAVSLLKQFEGLLLLSRNKTDILSFLVQDPHETLNPGDRPKSSWPSSEADEESFF
ncbi:hypothetical protein BC829DRAFT_301202 [Chytridium lagenaria]|nr:hypothetical protein BC829DRAFT_301202 [Chytridium lagenaria]